MENKKVSKNNEGVGQNTQWDQEKAKPNAGSTIPKPPASVRPTEKK